MAGRPTLIGLDYINLPLSELIKHPDYSTHARRIAEAVMGMTSAQLEKLEISKVGRWSSTA